MFSQKGGKWVLPTFLAVVLSLNPLLAFAEQTAVTVPTAASGATSYPPISSIRVPCTDPTKSGEPTDDYTGKSEFGQVSCSRAKKQLSDEVKDKINNVLAYYYEGKTVDFINSKPGMCVQSLNGTPVCELGTPNLTQSEKDKNLFGHQCSKLAVIGGAGVTDSECFSTRPADEQKCGDTRYKFYIAALADDEKEISELKIERDKYDSESWRYKHLNSIIASKQAVLDDPVKFANQELLPEWQELNSPSNDGYCKFTSSGVVEGTCVREDAWIRGFRVSIIEKHLEDVLSEVDQGTLNLVDFGEGNRPCQELAQSIKRQLDGDPSNLTARPGIRAAENAVRVRYGNTVAGTNATHACVLSGEESIDQVQELLTQSFKDTELGAGTGERNRISLAVCNLAMARRMLLRSFGKLAFCEASMRAKKQYYEIAFNPDEIYGEIQNKVADPCTSYAKGKFSIWHGCGKKCVKNHFSSCYKNGNGNIPNVSKVLYDLSRRLIPSKNKGVGKKLMIPGQNGQAPRVLEHSEVPNCASVGNGEK